MTSFGPGGYPDGQRVQNWDSPSLFSASPANSAAQIVSGVLNVSRFAYLVLYANLTGSPGDCAITIDWYQDRGATDLIGSRQVILSHSIPIAQWRPVNLGPYAIVQISPASGNLTGSFNLVASNRVHPLEFVPVNAVLVDNQNLAIAANGVDTLYPSDYYAGPLYVWLTPNFGTGFVVVEALTSSGNWDVVGGAKITTTGYQSLTPVVPPGAWRLLVENTVAAASTLGIAAVASVTGST